MIEDKGNFNGYDRKLEFSDWRFSAAAVGIIRYLKYHKLNYSTEYNGRSDVLLYNFDDIDISKNEEKYYDFAEEYFKDKMHHKRLKNLLNSEDFDEEKVKNLKSFWNTIMKNTFKNDANASDKGYRVMTWWKPLVMFLIPAALIIILVRGVFF